MHKIILFICIVVTTFIVAYNTYINRTTGVPVSRHNEVYEIINSDTFNDPSHQEKNYTQPFKKYSLIDDDDELNRSYVEPIQIDTSTEKVLENGLQLR